MKDHIRQKLDLLPEKPGCYLMKNAQDEIIYVGKAIKLKNRVRSYFVGSHNYKTTKLVSQIEDFETIQTTSEKEALVLEYNLIKKHAPRYNIMFMDDKSYPYLKLTKGKTVMLSVVRNVNDKKAEYFGPFPDSGAAYQIKDLLNRLYPLRKCKVMPKKACLYYHIHECLGPCIYDIDPAIYEKMREDIKRFLRGDVSDLVNSLTVEMNEASEKLNYELAKDKKDLIDAIKHVSEQQKVQFSDHKNRDVFACFEEHGMISIQGFFYHEGKILERALAIHSLVDEIEDTFESYIMQYYAKNPLPYEILIPTEFNAQVLSEALGVRVIQPLRGEKKKIVEMVIDNAKKSLYEQMETFQRNEDQKNAALSELNLLMNKEINTIEMIDNSHISGAYNCSGVVVFKEGQPSKKDYRLYRLDEYRSDTDSMKEVLYRRYYRTLMEKRPFSDLLIVDGGIYQIEAALEVIQMLNIEIEVLGLVKDDRHRTHHLLNANGEKIMIKSESPLFYFLTAMQDEVHRFAISYHRKLRSKAMTKSILDDIEGLGEVRKKEVWRKFKTIKKLQQASLEEIKSILPDNVAENVFELMSLSNHNPKDA